MRTVTQNLKICKVCGEWKPLSEFKTSWFGHEHKCIACRAPNRQGLARQRTRDGIAERKCSVCETWKPKDDFSTSKDNPEGTGYRCKPCMLEKSRVSWEGDKDGWRARQRSSYQANPETKRKAAMRYREANIDQVRAIDRERNKKRYQEHPEERAAYTHARRARERAADGSFTGSEFKQLCQKYGNRCLKCGGVCERLTPDHVVPLSKGGTNDLSNIQPLCLGCNLQKGTKSIDYR